MRNLLIFILVLIIVWWVRRALQKPRGGDPSRTHGASRQDRSGDPERMLECEHCGVHIPESEGLYDGDTFYCSEEHRRLGVRR